MKNTSHIAECLKEHPWYPVVKDHNGLFIVLCTAFIGVLGSIIKFFIFVFYCGRLKYWDLDNVSYSVSTSNIYSFVVCCLIAIVIVVGNAILYRIFESDRSRREKVISVVVSIAILTIIMLVYSFIFVFPNLNEIGIGLLVVYSVMLATMILALVFTTGIANGIIDRRNRLKHDKSKKTEPTNPDIIEESDTNANVHVRSPKSNLSPAVILVIVFTVLACLTLVMAYIMGYNSSKSCTEFKTVVISEDQGTVNASTDTTYAVVFETEEHYYLERCQDDKIDTTIQMCIDKNSVKTIINSNLKKLP